MESELKISRVFSLLKQIAIANPRVSGAKLAAAIVHKNKIISIGVNSMKSSPLQAKYATNKDLSIYLHAEISAIKNALRQIDVEDFKKVSLYVCRVKYDILTNSIVYGLAKPCSGCMRAIFEFDIKKVYYTLETEGWDQL
jgi:tRNA(Arg) A34 adenosine deaminase TadA